MNVYYDEFEWDKNKEELNIKKHGIDFETAAQVFSDNDRIEYYDEEHSDYEDRYITIGMVNGKAVVLYVSYTERRERVRIISARLAEKQEEDEYYDSKKAY